MIDNERRADLGADAIHAAAIQTGVIAQEPIATAIIDVLAYVAHLCDRVGLDPRRTFEAGLQSYVGDFEDGPQAIRLAIDASEARWDELDDVRSIVGSALSHSATQFAGD